MTIFNTAINSVATLSHYKANSAFVLIEPVDWNIGHMVEVDGNREKQKWLQLVFPPPQHVSYQKNI